MTAVFPDKFDLENGRLRINEPHKIKTICYVNHELPPKEQFSTDILDCIVKLAALDNEEQEIFYGHKEQ